MAGNDFVHHKWCVFKNKSEFAATINTATTSSERFTEWFEFWDSKPKFSAKDASWMKDETSSRTTRCSVVFY